MRSPSIEQARAVTPKSSYNATLNVVTSKSRANRMLFLAAIDKREIILEGIPDSSDVEDMLRCLKVIGLDIEQKKDTVIIKNSFPACESNSSSPLVIECGYGGTTTRFLSALLALGQRRYYLEAQGHMRERPMSEVLLPLGELGVEAVMNSDEAWLVIQGPVKHQVATLKVDSSRSTQFASALAMTVSTWNGKVDPVGMHASEDYFSMTIDCIEASKQKATWRVPVDFSSLSYPLALAALSGETLITNVHEVDQHQPDSIFIKILSEMGVEVGMGENGLHVKHQQKLKAWSGSCAGFPDLVPTLAVVCSYAEGESRLEGLEVLKHKESDRFNEVLNVLKLFGINAHGDDDTVVIVGPNKATTSPVEYIAPDDHRMIMMCALLMRLNNGGEIINWDHVKKSYPTFFEDVADS